jgi:hypothetical protein
MPNKIKDTIRHMRKSAADNRRTVNAILKWASANADALDKLDNVQVNFYPWSYYQVYFTNDGGLTHEQVIAIMSVVQAGKWTKNYGDGCITYYGSIDQDGAKLNVQIYGGAPPPNCKIVEEEVVEPSHYVPERKVIRRKVVCQEQAQAQAATAEAASEAGVSSEPSVSVTEGSAHQ